MRSFRSAFFTAAIAAVAQVPATAQQTSDSYTFLKAVREEDGAKVTDMLNRPGQRIVNATDRDNGEGALHIVVRRHDPTYLRFLLAKGADPNLRDGQGDTPAMVAVQSDFPAAIDILDNYNADFDVGNDRGETPLIRAVQNRDVAMVRKLLEVGADPDKADAVAGLSARDYAKRERRTPALLAAIEKGPEKDDDIPLIGPGF
ncbi:ankyrin repeat domain-containing protein [Stakelama saccharophila]|uniref:Ankyrin repeat domain-containing protein n=1 Tax=Stakelama saccharophila TaxID=3075605 RepID=A0ABZ0BAW7_9SPHN|nr:ankyrin repeat domain-containing protein [Stakelama sp. W311]WNO53993.1 ankyrin repeat domain-containing protein [Stakelama sp. W311]